MEDAMYKKRDSLLDEWESKLHIKNPDNKIKEFEQKICEAILEKGICRFAIEDDNGHKIQNPALDYVCCKYELKYIYVSKIQTETETIPSHYIVTFMLPGLQFPDMEIKPRLK